MSLILHELVGDQGRCFSPFCWRSAMALAHNDDPLHAWFGRCLDLHGGFPRDVPAYW